MSRGGGYDQFIRWLHAWEGMSGSLSADGTKYIIGDDGYGNITVGYGVDIFNGGFAERFAAAGYPTSVGSEVDKEFVDNLEKEEIQKDLDLVESKCGGLNLTQYQKYALVSRIYNCGDSGAFSNRNGKDFVSAFTSYWNQDKDLEYKVPANDYQILLRLEIHQYIHQAWLLEERLSGFYLKQVIMIELMSSMKTEAIL